MNNYENCKKDKSIKKYLIGNVGATIKKRSNYKCNVEISGKHRQENS